MRLVIVSLSIAVATLSVAHAAPPVAPAPSATPAAPAPPEPAGTARHVGLLHFLTKAGREKRAEPQTVLPGAGAGAPAVQTEPVAVAPEQAKPVAAPQKPHTAKTAAKAKPANRKSKKLAKKKRKPKPVEPDIARTEPEPEPEQKLESEQSGRASFVSMPAIEEQSAIAPPAAEPEIGPEEGTSLGQMIAYKARLAEGNLDGALAALARAVNTEPNLTMIARLNETIGVSLDAARAEAMVDKLAAASQTEQAPPSAPTEARIEAAHGLAAHVGGQTLLNALADYKKAVLANDIPAATFALTGFLGHPIDSVSVQQTNALLGLPADPSTERALATTAP